MTVTPLQQPTSAEHAAHHRSADELEAALPGVRSAPRDVGTLALLVRRPGVDQREVLERARLTTAEGMAGDSWIERSSSRTQDGSAHPDMQLNVMSLAAVRAVAGDDPHRWAWAGDELIVDLDLSFANLPAGALLEIGGEPARPHAVIEVTDQPHRGCLKFKDRFGKAALFWVNSEQGVPLRLRGLNARVVVEGEVRSGDEVRVRRPDGPFEPAPGA